MQLSLYFLLYQFHFVGLVIFTVAHISLGNHALGLESQVLGLGLGLACYGLESKSVICTLLGTTHSASHTYIHKRDLYGAHKSSCL